MNYAECNDEELDELVRSSGGAADVKLVGEICARWREARERVMAMAGIDELRDYKARKTPALL